MQRSWYELARDLTLQLVRIPSVTNTPGEITFAEQLRALMARHPYFAANPAQVWTEAIDGDPRGRSNLYALVRGIGPQTVILAGHFDVVSVENYDTLAPWAFDPAELLPRLITELRATGTDEAARLALADLESGAFLPGRGVLDMKSGLAAGIAVLYHLAEAPTALRGNLLLIATPDEEDSSHGMRSAAMRLPALTQALELDPVAAINLDATVDRGDGREGQAIFLGSVGKLLPTVYIAGRETHAGAPFDGCNPNVLAAEITRRIECNTVLCDVALGEAAPPPVTLSQRDLKAHYDVTTPAAAWCAYNFLSYTRSTSDVLAIMRDIARAAAEDIARDLHGQAAAYATLTAQAPAPPAFQPLILTFDELRELAVAHSGRLAEETMVELAVRLSGDPEIDLPQFCRRMTVAIWGLCGLASPAVVLGFGSLYYPPVQLQDGSPRHATLRAIAAEQAAVLAEELAIPIRVRPFLPGISDMSFLGCTDTPGDLEAMALNTPAWGMRIRHDYQAVQPLMLPTINIGPWGRDYHQRTERVYIPYAFGVLPELIARIVESLFDA